MRIVRFHVYAIDLPFRRPFKPAAAERASLDSILLECETEDGSDSPKPTLPASV